MTMQATHPIKLATPAQHEPIAAAIRVRDLSVSYGKLQALRGVNLDIAAGQVTALIGPSGCGKSSFLNTLNRMTDLIRGCTVAGNITLNGQSIHTPEINPIALRRRVGMIFQKPNPFPFSIKRNIELPLKEHGMGRREHREHTTEAVLRDVGLWDEVKDRLNTPAQTLSGGQQQRLCIARALALQPDILLMDEPCSALDPIASGIVEKMILRLRSRVTLVVVTHNLAQAQRVADHTAVFWVRDGCGAMIEAGTTADIFAAPLTEEVRNYIAGRCC